MQEFFKSCDWYAKNVTLTYKKSGAFETSVGGLCTILSFIILTYWLAVNIFYSLYNYGSFAASATTVIT